MKTVIAILLVFAAICFTACSKGHAIETVSGKINGVPAVTLYGNSNRPADYLLINMNDKQVSYNGQVYSYYYSSTDNIFITVSIANLIGASLVTTGTKTVLTITSSATFFGSPVYTSY